VKIKDIKKYHYETLFLRSCLHGTADRTVVQGSNDLYATGSNPAV
jgi:hypothetical protein